MLDKQKLEIIKREIKELTDFHYNDIVSHCRIPELVEARDLLIWYLSKYEEMENTRIGRLLDRDHTTITHSLRKTKKNRYLIEVAVLFFNKITKKYEKLNKKNLQVVRRKKVN